MRHLKMLGLAVMTAAALIALVEASSASATVLCTETVTPCPVGKKVGPTGDSTDSWIHAVLEEGTSFYMFSTSGNTQEPLVTCTESTITAESEATGSSTETAKGTVEAKNVTLGGCTPPGVKTIKGGTLEVHWIEGTRSQVEPWRQSISMLSSIWERVVSSVPPRRSGRQGTRSQNRSRSTSSRNSSVRTASSAAAPPGWLHR